MREWIVKKKAIRWPLVNQMSTSIDPVSCAEKHRLPIVSLFYFVFLLFDFFGSYSQFPLNSFLINECDGFFLLMLLLIYSSFTLRQNCCTCMIMREWIQLTSMHCQSTIVMTPFIVCVCVCVCMQSVRNKRITTTVKQKKIGAHWFEIGFGKITIAKIAYCYS